MKTPMIDITSFHSEARWGVLLTTESGERQFLIDGVCKVWTCGSRRHARQKAGGLRDRYRQATPCRITMITGIHNRRKAAALIKAGEKLARLLKGKKRGARVHCPRKR